MSPALLDALLLALLEEAGALGAERLKLALEPVDDAGGAGPQSCARCWRGEAVLHHRPIAWRAWEAAIRRAAMNAGLDPWQFRRPQTATWAGRTCTLEGGSLQQRRLTVRGLESKATHESAPARADAALATLAAALEDAERERVEPSLEALAAMADDAPLVQLVNLVWRDATLRGVQRVEASGGRARFVYRDGTTEDRDAWPAQLWPDVRRRFLHMGQLEPWERGPALAYVHLRVGGQDEATWTLEVPDREDRLVLNLISVRHPRTMGKAPAPAPRPAAELDPQLRAVLDAPADLRRRGVYADALLERGDARGRFINHQLAARGPASADAPPPDAAQWCGALGELARADAARFAWGFLDRLVVGRPQSGEPWDAIARDPHWATVRALRFPGPRTGLQEQVLGEAPLASLEALALSAPLELNPAPAVVGRLSALCVTGMDARMARWLDGLDLPALAALELQLDENPAPGANATQLRLFFASKAARMAPDLIIDARARPGLWVHFAQLPPSAQRVSLPFLPAGVRGPFVQALVCTVRRAAAGGPFSEASIHGEVDALYRGAQEVLTALVPMPGLGALRFVASDRALDRGRVAVLTRTCAKLLPHARVEASVGACDAPLWWLAEAPLRRATS